MTANQSTRISHVTQTRFVKFIHEHNIPVAPEFFLILHANLYIFATFGVVGQFLGGDKRYSRCSILFGGGHQRLWVGQYVDGRTDGRFMKRHITVVNMFCRESGGVRDSER